MVKVEEGWVALEGELPWHYQREVAQNAVSYLTGVKGVTNNIQIKLESHYVIEKKKVENAIARNWSVKDNDINVSVSGTTVTLTGTVNSWYQRDEAGRIAWKTPGILDVKNELVVDYEFMLID
ncbi:BON domain-containing protein [Chitinophaga sancti]|uniref:BON domain-containing protein n=1 Tax=Chitinophaga sancti TaxID=1004 RepID=UPI0039BE577C